jgi:hypothetical protein
LESILRFAWTVLSRSELCCQISSIFYQNTSSFVHERWTHTVACMNNDVSKMYIYIYQKFDPNIYFRRLRNWMQFFSIYSYRGSRTILLQTWFTKYPLLWGSSLGYVFFASERRESRGGGFRTKWRVVLLHHIIYHLSKLKPKGGECLLWGGDLKKNALISLKLTLNLCCDVIPS